MTSVQADTEAAHTSEAGVNEDDVGKFVSQDVKVEKGRVKAPGQEPAYVEDEADRKIEEGVGAPELLPEGEAVAGITQGVEVGVEEGDGDSAQHGVPGLIDRGGDPILLEDLYGEVLERVSALCDRRVGEQGPFDDLRRHQVVAVEGATEVVLEDLMRHAPRGRGI